MTITNRGARLKADMGSVATEDLRAVVMLALLKGLGASVEEGRHA